MRAILNQFEAIQTQCIRKLQWFDGIAPLLMRLILIPVFWMAGIHKIDVDTFMPYPSLVEWFGNPEWGLGLPAPMLMAFLAGWTELLGAVLLTVGLAVRWISIPLIVTMLVAIFTVHWEFGWQAIADPSGPFANERVLESAARLAKAKELLQEYGNYEWLTARGSLVVLNNGIEFAAIYLVLLVSLLSTGGGRFTSLDFWLQRYWLNSRQASVNPRHKLPAECEGDLSL